MTAENELAQLQSLYGPLADSLRRLIDLSIRTEADAALIATAKAKIDSAADDLSTSVSPGSFGVRQTRDSQPTTWGNVLIGLRNPIAPPLEVHRGADGEVWADLTLGAPYEGPAGHVHGGVCALILDHVLAATAHKPGRPAVTGTLCVRYLRGTPLGSLRAEARIDRVEGSKTFAVGHIADAEGITVQAEGVFIRPRNNTP